MTYTPIRTYQNSPSTATPLSADNINTSLADLATYTDAQILAATGGSSSSISTVASDLAGLTYLVPAPTGVEATDTAAIQAKLTAAAAAGGGTVVLRVGTYTINAALLIDDFTTLKGQGFGARSSEYSINTPGAAVLKMGGAKNFNMIENADPVNGNSGIIITDLAFHMNVSPAADIAAVQFTKVRRSALTHVSLLGGVTTTRRGFYILGASEIVMIHECYLEGNGIFSTGSSNLVIVSKTEVGNGCVYFDGGFGHQLIGCQIYKDGVSSDHLIGECIRLNNVKESLFALNNVRGAYNSHNIYLKTGCYRNVICNNHVYEAGRKTAGTWSGIVLESDTVSAATEKNVVIGNVCYDRQATKTQQYGIEVKSFSGTQTNDNIVRNNILLDNRNAAGLLVGTAGLRNTITDNIVNTSGPLQTLATDVAFTLTPHTSPTETVHTGTLTADRAVTLSTTNAVTGMKFLITRTGGGAFNLNVGTGPLKALATNTWGEVTYNGTAWYLSRYGAL